MLNSLIEAQDKDFEGCDWDQFESEERGHGRQEKRIVTVLYDTECIEDRSLWEKLTVIGMC